MLWLFGTGLVSLLGQVVLLRELNVAFYGSELVYLLGLGAWLLWTASGAALGRCWQARSGRPIRLLFVLLALAVPLSVVLCRGTRPILGATPGAYLSFPVQLAALSVVLAPAGCLLGLLFPLPARRLVAAGGTAASAYALESAGAVFGGILATLAIRLGLQNLSASLMCGILAAASGFVAARGERARIERSLSGIVGAVLIALLVWSSDLDRALTRWTHPMLVSTRDTPYSRVTVSEHSGQVAVFVNDALAFESQGTAAEEFVHLTALSHPDPRSMLILGGTLEGVAAEARLHRPDRLDVVEIDLALLNVVRRLLPVSVEGPLSDPRVRLRTADPRRWLERTDETYDLILVAMPEPESGQSNRFYTEEFFCASRRRLADEGLLGLRLRGSENVWTAPQLRRAAGVRNALLRCFDDVVVFPGGTHVLLASNVRIPRDPDALATRLAQRGIATRRVTAAYLRYAFTNDRFVEAAARLDAVPAPPNSDTRPVCYLLTLMLWLARFFPSLAVVDPTRLDAGSWPRHPATWVVLAFSGTLLLAARRTPAVRSALFVASTGFAGMVLETALLLRYQARSGVLYQDIGFLLTAFMAGLALGSSAIHAWRQHRSGGHRFGGAPWALLLALVGGIVAWSTVFEWGAGLAASATLLLATGALVACAFGHAATEPGADASRAVSSLYAADLIGGCGGALAASLFLVPVAGLDGAAIASVLVALGAALVG